MSICKFNLNNQFLIILITSIIWAINFRSSFDNINAHMDSVSFESLKFEPFLILIKNILCIFYFLAFFIESKLFNKVYTEEQIMVVTKKLDNNSNLIEYNVEKNKSKKKLGEMKAIVLSNRLDNSKEKFFFLLKVILLIIFIYISEELYFILSNNHILDRIICPIRNIVALIAILILSLVLLHDKKQIKNIFFFKRHQIVPLIIIFSLSLGLIFYNIFGIDRFKKIYNINMLYYSISFILMGCEFPIIKYLVDKLFINKFIILGIKGILGTIVFIIVNIKYNKDEFYQFFDKLLSFEYIYKKEESKMTLKIIFVVSLFLLQYLKIVVINKLSDISLISTLMITDIIYFPFYCIERFVIQGFKISTISSFIYNSLVGIINTFMMLIFNEILEINCCGLNKHLRKNIIKREMSEFKNIKQNENNNEDDIYCEEDECDD